MLGLYEDAVISGIAIGGVYALIAVGITQSYKVTRVLNFAQAGFIIWGAYMYTFFSNSLGWPVGLAAVTSVAVLSAMGLIAELTVFRFAKRATILNKSILTFAILLFLSALAVKVFGNDPRGAAQLFPNGGITLIGQQTSWNQLATLGISLAIVAALFAFLRFTRIGLLTRAVAEDGTMAQALGARRSRIDSLSWTIAAGIAGLAGVLLAPLFPFTSADFFQFFIIGLVAALIGGMQSLTLAAVGGLIVGVVNSVVGVRFPQPGSPELAVFCLVVLIALVSRGRRTQIAGGSWGSDLKAAPPAVLGAFTRLTVVGGWVALIIAAFTSMIWAQTGSVIVVYVLAALSLIPLVGWTGQISLAQGAFMGIGAYAMGEALTEHRLPFAVAVLIGLGAGVVAGGLVGVITRRLSFILTAITTLSFSLAVDAWLFNDDDVFHTIGGQFSITVPGVLSGGTDRFVAGAIVTIVVVGGLQSLRASRFGLRMGAVQSAPVMARHFGIRPERIRIYAFCLSGGIASLAGMLYVVILQTVSPIDFGLDLSLEVLLLAVAGGVTALYGPFTAALGFQAIPQLLGLAKYGGTGYPDILAAVGTANLIATNDDGFVSMMRQPANAKSRWGIDRLVRSRRGVAGVAPNGGASEAVGASADDPVADGQADAVDTSHSLLP